MLPPIPFRLLQVCVGLPLQPHGLPFSRAAHNVHPFVRDRKGLWTLIMGHVTDAHRFSGVSPDHKGRGSVPRPAVSRDIEFPSLTITGFLWLPG
jgi:hypothetical protein